VGLCGALAFVYRLMTVATFICRGCGSRNSFNRLYTVDEDACKVCKMTNFWRREDEPEVPIVEWALNENDRRFLRSLKIGAE
jgi:hydrogenase maturation factor HypF (carbamoyltransferase family)